MKESLIVESSRTAQKLISILFAEDPDNETFEQVGLIDGHTIVLDYIKAGEEGVALHHTLYMVHESDIAFPRHLMLELHELANAMGLKNHYSKENQKNLSKEQLESIFNAP